MPHAERDDGQPERLLAVVLAIFLLIGGIWAYVKFDDWVRTSTPPDYSYRGTPAEQAALGREERAATLVARAERMRKSRAAQARVRPRGRDALLRRCGEA